jgi:hypothetical protein
MKWLKHSGIWIGLVINPYHWQLRFLLSGPTELDPAMRSVYLHLGPIWIKAVLDDGSW